MNQTEQNTKRLTDLESSIMHLQNDFDSINEVVLDMSRRIDELSAMIQRLQDRFEAATSASEQPRSAEDEKPPHY